jgi:hypothetical protein
MKTEFKDLKNRYISVPTQEDYKIYNWSCSDKLKGSLSSYKYFYTNYLSKRAVSLLRTMGLEVKKEDGLYKVSAKTGRDIGIAFKLVRWQAKYSERTTDLLRMERLLKRGISLPIALQTVIALDKKNSFINELSGASFYVSPDKAYIILPKKDKDWDKVASTQYSTHFRKCYYFSIYKDQKDIKKLLENSDKFEKIKKTTAYLKAAKLLEESVKIANGETEI